MYFWSRPEIEGFTLQRTTQNAIYFPKNYSRRHPWKQNKRRRHFGKAVGGLL
jgi:hypothetical protein